MSYDAPLVQYLHLEIEGRPLEVRIEAHIDLHIHRMIRMKYGVKHGG